METVGECRRARVRPAATPEYARSPLSRPTARPPCPTIYAPSADRLRSGRRNPWWTSRPNSSVTGARHGHERSVHTQGERGLQGGPDRARGRRGRDGRGAHDLPADPVRHRPAGPGRRSRSSSTTGTTSSTTSSTAGTATRRWTARPSAGIPPTELCLNCHSQVWNKSPLLDVVRASWFSGQPIPWMRVHRLPGFVYFNHAIHVNKGVGCVECHGRVDQMAGDRAGRAAQHGLVPRLPPEPVPAPPPARRRSPT